MGFSIIRFFKIQINLEASGAHMDLSGRIPIMLGTIPLMNIEMQNTRPYTVSIAPIARTQEQATAPSIQELWNTYPSLGKSYESKSK